MAKVTVVFEDTGKNGEVGIDISSDPPFSKDTALTPARTIALYAMSQVNSAASQQDGGGESSGGEQLDLFDEVKD